MSSRTRVSPPTSSKAVGCAGASSIGSVIRSTAICKRNRRKNYPVTAAQVSRITQGLQRGTGQHMTQAQPAADTRASDACCDTGRQQPWVEVQVEEKHPRRE